MGSKLQIKLVNPMQCNSARLRNFTGQVIAIKIGGNLLNNKKTVAVIVSQIAELTSAGAHVVLIHGGGTHINTALDYAGIKSKKIEGLRVTDKSTLDIVVDVLANINKNLVEDFQGKGIAACGFRQPHDSILQAKKLKLKNEKLDLGFVGEIERTDAQRLNACLEKGGIPVIAPIGKDVYGNFYNINADHVACAVASALKADRLIFLTDVPGVLANAQDPSLRIDKIQSDKILEHIDNGIIKGGMLPKLKSCLAAIEDGVKKIVVINGMQGEAIICALLYPDRFGTLIEEKIS